MTELTPPPRGASESDIAAFVEAVISQATRAEKIAMMSGKGFFELYRESGGVWGAHPYPAGSGIARFGVPPLYFTDGPRGVARGQSTCFPCTMARGASFDPDLEHRIGQVMGIEARAQGCTLSGAVCMNLLRHPAWGRAQETYGEDSWHLGVMGAALGTGIQVHNVIATVKHFALNSMENARFRINVRIDERVLHEIYLPHFKYALDAGVASVMSAYNKINGEYCGQDRYLLSDVLRAEWGFDGFVHSDWIRGVYKPYGAAAGLDIENPEPMVFGEKLAAAVEAGTIEPYVIDRACRRILHTQYRFATAEDPFEVYPKTLVASPEHCALAREAAEKSAVLLENNDCLPFSRDRIQRLAVLGRLADLKNTGDNGSSRVHAPYCITPLAGLRDYLGAEAILTATEDDLDGARSAALAADAVVIIAGYTHEDEGEYIPADVVAVNSQSAGAARNAPLGGDRILLELPSEQQELIEVAAATGKPVVVVVVAGSAVLVERWHTKASAILQTFYAGMEGGTALARLLFGEVSPSGKLPFTVARAASDYPFFDRDADEIEYDYWHGYAKFDYEGISPRYGFGHGLSYTQFAYRALKARRLGNDIEVSVAVHNVGKRSADEVVQYYVGCPADEIERPIKTLRGFSRVSLLPGQTRIVRTRIALDSLRWRDPVRHCWRFEHGPYRIMAGGSSQTLIETSINL